MAALTTSVSLTCTSSTSLKVSTLSAPLPVFIDSVNVFMSYPSSLPAESLSWQEVELAPCPPKRYGHSLAVLGKRLVVFGGQDLEQELSDLWTLKVDGWSSL